jgi:RNA polymerase-binding transcription factor DksA
MKKTKKIVKKPVVKAKTKVKAKAKPSPKPVRKAAKVAVKKAAVKIAAKSAPNVPARKIDAKKAAPVVEAPPKTLKLSKGDAEKYKRLLLNLRDHLIDGVNFLATDNLKRSNRDASGELSGYSLHMADAGTDNFDREFALSLVSNEQEALYEIEEALKRMEDGTYGVCEMCEKIIRKERLKAVPFARMCVQCQAVSERENHHRPAPVTGLFNETADEESEEKEEAEEKD